MNDLIGWRVIVPDILGYGDTEKPTEVSLYSTKSVCHELAALLDLVDVTKVILVAHDWGAEIGWRMCLWHPERVHAIAAWVFTNNKIAMVLINHYIDFLSHFTHLHQLLSRSLLLLNEYQLLDIKDTLRTNNPPEKLRRMYVRCRTCAVITLLNALVAPQAT